MKIKTTTQYDKWLKGLKDKMAVARILVRVARIKVGNFGNCEPVGVAGFLNCGLIMVLATGFILANGEKKLLS